MSIKQYLLIALSAFSATSTFASQADSTATPRISYGFSAVTEAQWNLKTGRSAWANLLTGELGVELWQGARFEAGGIATFTAGSPEVDCMQDFSNINAESRAFRLVHAGLSQQFGRVQLFAGLRQADEDYWNTPLAGLFMGSSYGCLPTINDNYALNVYPCAALGLHAEWAITPQLTAKTSLYNGTASDRFDAQFRFRPSRDGITNLGALVLTIPSPLAADRDDAEATPATYLLGWNTGRVNHEGENHQETLFGAWATVEQPVCAIGSARLALSATAAKQFDGPAAAKAYWNGALVASHLTPLNVTAGVGVSRAYYDGANETDVDVTLSLPVTSRLSLQPAFHFLRTSGESNTAAHLRVCWQL